MRNIPSWVPSGYEAMYLEILDLVETGRLTLPNLRLAEKK